jgi:type III secretory pathway component EscT
VIPLHDVGGAASVVLLSSLRLLPVALVSPFVGGPLVPPIVRVALAVGLGVVGASLAAPGGAPPSDGLALVGAAVRELTLGAVLALLASAPVDAARAAGRLADTFRGATLAELHVAPIRQKESALADLLAHWVVVLAAWVGGDRLVVGGLLGTFGAIPPGTAFVLERGRDAALAAAAETVSCAVAVGAPVAAGVLGADLALAAVSRVAPQLGAVNTAQPARAALGLLAVAAVASAASGRLVALAALAGQAPVALAGGR